MYQLNQRYMLLHIGNKYLLIVVRNNSLSLLLRLQSKDLLLLQHFAIGMLSLCQVLLQLMKEQSLQQGTLQRD
jgi:hypothetical protein